MSKSPKIMNFVDGPREIKVGDTVFYTNGQFGHHHQGYEGIVKSVGREYAIVGRNTRYHLATGLEKTEYVKGKLYSSEEAYRRSKDLERYTDQVRNRCMGYSFQPTYEQAQAIAKIMGWTIETQK